MFTISMQKKEEFWKILADEPHPAMLTSKRMKILKNLVMQDADFWDDIIARHGGLETTAAQLKVNEPLVYQHCLGNFHGMLIETLVTELAKRVERS